MPRRAWRKGTPCYALRSSYQSAPTLSGARMHIYALASLDATLSQLSVRSNTVVFRQEDCPAPRGSAIFAGLPRCVTNPRMGFQTAGPPSGDVALMDTRRHSFEYEDLLACGRGELF